MDPLKIEELHRVIQRIRNTPIERPEDEPGLGKTIQIEEKSDESKMGEDFETESTSFNNAIDVPAIILTRCVGATGESATYKWGKRAT